LNRTKSLGDMSNTNVDEELNSTVDQLKEVTLRVGNINYAMMTHIAEL
jgi:hypothetical protein